MNQKTRSLVTLLALVVLAGGGYLFAYYGIFKKQEAETAAKEKSEKLFDFDRAKVKGLSVTAKGQTTLLTKGKDGWDVVSPVQAPADKMVVDAIVDKLLSLKSKMTVEEKASDLARFGLDRPGIKLVVQLEGAPDAVLRVGAENSFDNTLYAARGEANDVFQVENLKFSVEKDTFELREKKVLSFEDAQARELSVKVDGKQWAIRKAGDQWQMSAPFADKADPATVNRILSSLHNLRATKFATDLYSPTEEATYGFKSPKLELTLTLDGGGQINLVAGQVEQSGQKKSYARRKEATFVAEVAELIFTDFDVKPMDLRDKTVVAFDRNQVEGLKFAFGSEVVALEKVKSDAGGLEDWKITAPAAAAAKKGKVSSILWALGSLKVASFGEEGAKDLARYGLDKPAKTVTLLGEGGKELATLALGKEENSNQYVKSSTDKRVLEVEKSKLAELPSSKADLEEAAQTSNAAPAPAPAN